MRKQRIDGQETRRQLLASAGEIFAAKGFRAATLAEICRLAGANVAAANYHFGNKEKLYVECWRFAFEQSLEAYPADGGVPAEAPVEDRLRGSILAIMRRVIDPRSHELDIVYKEMANPTGLLADAIPRALEPIFSRFRMIIEELLGPGATEQEIRLCLMSIHTQCFGPLMRERRRKLDPVGPKPLNHDPALGNVKELAEHVTRFSLAGIRSIRKQADERRQHTGAQAIQ